MNRENIVGTLSNSASLGRVDAPSQSEVSREFNRVGGAVDQLAAALERLQNKVQPVFADRPQTKDAGSPVTPPCSTVIGKALHDHSDRLFRLCDDVIALTNGIEL